MANADWLCGAEDCSILPSEAGGIEHSSALSVLVRKLSLSMFHCDHGKERPSF